MTATAENLQQFEPEQPELMENQPEISDWSDWGAAITELETREVSDQEEGITEAEAASEDDTEEAGVAVVDMFFVLSEELISFATGLEFEYNEKAKNKVLKAAGPLMKKHGDTWLNWLGQYKEEVLFLVAVVGLGGVTTRQVKTLRAEKLAQLAQEQPKKEESTDEEIQASEPATA